MKNLRNRRINEKNNNKTDCFMKYEQYKLKKYERKYIIPM